MKSEVASIIVPAKKNWLEFLDMSIDAALQTMRVEDAQRLSFAIHEAVINAVRVSEDIDEGKCPRLEVNIKAGEDWVEIRIWDEGPGFSDDLQEKIACINSAELLASPSGRGLMFINKFVDEVRSEVGEDARHVLVMRKKRRSGSSECEGD